MRESCYESWKPISAPSFQFVSAEQNMQFNDVFQPLDFMIPTQHLTMATTSPLTGQQRQIV